jgi:hypothetical protein
MLSMTKHSDVNSAFSVFPRMGCGSHTSQGYSSLLG